jgi:hypothetical protein
MQAPNSLAIPCEMVGFPQWQCAKLFRILHVLEVGQHYAKLIHDLRRQPFGAVLQIELSQALVDEVPYFHLTTL